MVYASPAAMAQAQEDARAAAVASQRVAEHLSPQEANAIANSPQARSIADIVNNQLGPFGQLISAEVVRRPDALIAITAIPADGVIAVPALVQFYTDVSPDGITQSREVTAQRMIGQVDWQTRSIALQLDLGITDENWDAIQANSVFEMEYTDANTLRRPTASGILRAQADFDVAITTTVAATTTEVNLVTGIDPRGVDLAPTDYIDWLRNETIDNRLRFTPAFTLPVALGAGGTTTNILNLLFGAKQTDTK